MKMQKMRCSIPLQPLKLDKKIGKLLKSSEFHFKNFMFGCLTKLKNQSIVNLKILPQVYSFYLLGERTPNVYYHRN